MTDTRYLEYILRSENARILYAANMQGAVSRRRSIPKERMRTLKIPLPPIEIQREIVAELDGYQKIIDAAQTIIKTHKPIIKINPEWPDAALEDATNSPKNDIVDGPFGSNLKSSEYIDAGVPIVRLQNVERFSFIDKNIKYISENKAKALPRHSYAPGDIVVTKLGSPLGSVS